MASFSHTFNLCLFFVFSRAKQFVPVLTQAFDFNFKRMLIFFLQKSLIHPTNEIFRLWYLFHEKIKQELVVQKFISCLHIN